MVTRVEVCTKQHSTSHKYRCAFWTTHFQIPHICFKTAVQRYTALTAVKTPVHSCFQKFANLQSKNSWKIRFPGIFVTSKSVFSLEHKNRRDLANISNILRIFVKNRAKIRHFLTKTWFSTWDTVVHTAISKTAVQQLHRCSPLSKSRFQIPHITPYRTFICVLCGFVQTSTLINILWILVCQSTVLLRVSKTINVLSDWLGDTQYSRFYIPHHPYTTSTLIIIFPFWKDPPLTLIKTIIL